MKMASSPEQAVAIPGTSRSDGNTREVVEAIVSGRPVEIVDLSRLRFMQNDRPFPRLATRAKEVAAAWMS